MSSGRKSAARGQVRSVPAESAELVQSIAGDVTANRVDMRTSAALRMRGSLINVNRSAVVGKHANEITIANGVTNWIGADLVKLDGYAGLVAAKRVELGRALAAVVAGREVRGQEIKALVVIGNQLEGNVSVLFDTRRALLAGLVGGLFAGLMLALTRGVLRRA